MIGSPVRPHKVPVRYVTNVTSPHQPPPPLFFSWTDLMDVDVVYFSVYLYDSSTDLTSISVPYTILWDLISDCNYQHKRPTHSPVLSLPISRRQAQLSSVWCAK